MSDRLEDPPHTSLEERAGGGFSPASDPDDGRQGGCSAGCAGCLVAILVAISAVVWFTFMLGREPSRGGPVEIESEADAPRGGIPERARPAPGRPEARLDPPAHRDPARHVDAKLRAIQQAILDPSRRIREGMLTYHEWCDPEGGPMPGGPDPRPPAPLTDVEVAAQKIASAIAEGPETSTLDAAARRWTHAVQALGPLLQEASRYYAQKTWQTDAYAGGRALHGRLEKAWTGWSAVQSEIEGVISVEETALSGSLLPALEADPGRAWELRARRVYDAAKGVRETLLASPLPRSDQGRKKAVRALEELRKAADALAPAPVPAGARPLAGTSSVQRAARDLHAAADELLSQLTAPRQLTEADQKRLRGPHAWRVIGTPERVQQRHEMLLEAYLRLRFE